MLLGDHRPHYKHHSTRYVGVESGWGLGQWEEHRPSVQEPTWLHGTINSVSRAAFSKTPASQNKGISAF